MTPMLSLLFADCFFAASAVHMRYTPASEKADAFSKSRRLMRPLLSPLI
jgi:hypothetical protein